MKHIQRTLAVLVLLALTIPVLLPAINGAIVENQIQAKTDIEILGGTQLHGGGHITWAITGSEADTLRQKVLDNFDFNHDGRLQSYEVRSPSGNGYLNAVERYVETESIQDVQSGEQLKPYWGVNIGGSAPLHVNNQDLTVDVQGLIGTTYNTTGQNIYIYYYYDCTTNLGKTIMQMDDDRMVQALYYPFDETYHGTTTISNTVYMVGLSSYSSPSSPDKFVMLRNPSGEIIWYSQTYDASKSHATITFSDFNFLENAQILFVIVLIGAYVSVSMPNRAYFEYRKKFPRKMRSRAKKIRWLHILSKVFVLLLLLFYFVPTMGPIFFSGIMIWIISISFAVVSTVLSRMAYAKAEVPDAPAPRYTAKPQVRSVPPPPADHVPATRPVQRAPVQRAKPKPKPKKETPRKSASRPLSKPDAPAPAAAAAIPDEKACGICLRPITKGMDSVTCQSCGREYHLTCAKKEVHCPSCNQKIIAPKKVSMQCFSCGEIFEIEEGEDLLFVNCPACGVVQKKLETGLNYLILGTNPRVAFSMLKTLVSLGAQGLALSTTFPSKLKKAYGLNNVEIRWFTDTTSEEGTIDPKRLEFEATRTISNFIKEMESAVILIDGLEYLVVENGFDNVLRFIKKINDISSVNGATLIMSVNPKSMSQDELTVLMKDFDIIEDLTKDKKHTT